MREGEIGNSGEIMGKKVTGREVGEMSVEEYEWEKCEEGNWGK